MTYEILIVKLRWVPVLNAVKGTKFLALSEVEGEPVLDKKAYS